MCSACSKKAVSICSGLPTGLGDAVEGVRGGGVRVPGIERIKGEDNIPSGGDAVVDMSDGWRWRAGGGKAENCTGLGGGDERLPDGICG